MTKTLSTMIPLGMQAPDFKLLDVTTNKFIQLKDVQSNLATVIMFICNHCPYVKHLQSELVEFANHYQKKGITFIAISSNDIASHPQDGPTYMRLEAENNHYPFPYLYDETQEVAKAYQAACTPDFYIFDNQLHCVYRGRFDDSTPGNENPITGKDLSQALDDLLDHKVINQNQIPSIGCNIKWKK